MSHSLETRALISANRKGKAVGHPYWGPKKWTDEQRAKLKGRGKKTYPKRECLRPECSAVFQVVSKDPHKKYCSRRCSGNHIGRTVLARTGVGRTPSEGAGRCRWYEHDSPIAGRVKVQGTWELRVAHCLDAEGRPWRTNHNRDRFAYRDINGEPKTYAPDFWQAGTYIEVKGYLDPAAQHKLEVVGRDIPLRVVRWADLKAWETALFGAPRGGVNTPPTVVERLSA